MITIKNQDKVLISSDSIETIKYFIKKKIEDIHKRIISCEGVTGSSDYQTDIIKRLLVQKLKSCDKLEELNRLLIDVCDSVDRSGMPIKGVDFTSGTYQIIT